MMLRFPLLLLFAAALALADSARVEITGWEEIANHRTSPAAVIRTSDARLFQGVEVRLVVDAQGAVVSARSAGQPSQLDDQALSQARQLHYRPFERNGHAVTAEFSERVRVLPPEQLPTSHPSTSTERACR